MAAGGNVSLTSTTGNIDLDGDVVTSGTGMVNVDAVAGTITQADRRSMWPKLQREGDDK